jgi:hypothetical protein
MAAKAAEGVTRAQAAVVETADTWRLPDQTWWLPDQLVGLIGVS